MIFPLMSLNVELETASAPAEDRLAGRCDLSRPVIGPEEGDPTGAIRCTADDGSEIFAACGPDNTTLDRETGYLVCHYPAGHANPERILVWSVLSAYSAPSIAAGLLIMLTGAGRLPFKQDRPAAQLNTIIPAGVATLSVMQVLVAPYLIHGWLAENPASTGDGLLAVVSDFLSITRIIFIMQGALAAIMLVQLRRNAIKRQNRV
jgi:hypothetical protein